MAPSRDSYTAKLTNGPLEGRTITLSFLDSGEPQPRIEIPSGAEGKRYVYARGQGVEFAAEGSQPVLGDAEHALPSAVDYHYLEAVFN